MRRLPVNSLASRVCQSMGTAVFVLVIILGASAGADPVSPSSEHCVTNVRSDDALNMRVGPGTSAGIITQKRYGECGIFLTGPCHGNWCPVEDGLYAGWVHRHYIAMVSPSLYCVHGVSPDDWLNLRAWPSPQSRVLARLDPRACGIAFLPYTVGNWQKIRVDGWEGWAHRRYLSGQ